MNHRIAVAVITAALVLPALAQQATPPPAQPGRGGRGPQGPVVVSPEVQPDRHVIFRILAPQAESVRLVGGDIPGNGQGAPMTKRSQKRGGTILERPR